MSILTALTRAARRYAVPIFLVAGAFAVVLGKDWAMFVGMMLCLATYALERCCTQAPTPSAPAKLYWVIAIPAVLDLISTFMMNVGLLLLSSSIWQMLRGSIIVFTAILKVTYRRKRLRNNEWIGVAVVLSALMVVGGSSFKTPQQADDASEGVESGSLLSSSSSSEGAEPADGLPTAVKMVVGIALVFFAQFMQASQTIIEEKLLHDVQAPATLIVGMEGLWGFLLCSLICMPIAYVLPGKEGDGLHENTLDSFVMLYNSPAILGLVIAYVAVILLFNIYGMIITEVTDAMVRNLLEPIRTLFIWVIMVFIHYVITSKFGESVNIWSLMELGGFVILCFGFLIYNNVIKVPCCAEAEEEEKKPLVDSSVNSDSSA
eukprot:m51a1_g8206 putative integral membrane (376) ;mRNA; f:50511-52025